METIKVIDVVQWDAGGINSLCYFYANFLKVERLAFSGSLIRLCGKMSLNADGKFQNTTINNVKSSHQ